MTPTSHYYPVREVGRKRWTILERRGTELWLFAQGYRDKAAAQSVCDSLNADAAKLAAGEYSTSKVDYSEKARETSSEVPA